MRRRPYSYITLKALALFAAMLLIELIGQWVLKMKGTDSAQSIAGLKVGCYTFLGLGGIILGIHGISQAKKKEPWIRNSQIAEWIIMITAIVSTWLYVLYHYLHARFGIL